VCRLLFLLHCGSAVAAAAGVADVAETVVGDAAVASIVAAIAFAAFVTGLIVQRGGLPVITDVKVLISDLSIYSNIVSLKARRGLCQSCQGHFLGGSAVVGVQQ